ncbi:MAG: hypothetical protein ACREBS_10050 [Nitrososphaerales archaeon]
MSEGRGVVFAPSVFRYSTKVSNVTDAEFQNSNVRAVSLYKAFKFFGYDGVFCEINPLVSLEATGQMGETELNADQMVDINTIKSSIETCSKLVQMIGKGEVDLMSTIYGATFMRKRYSLEVKNHFVLADNLANLARLYFDAGCTCLVIPELTLNEDVLESYRSIINLAGMYSAQTVMLVEENLSEAMISRLDEAGFSFVHPSISTTMNNTQCIVVDPKDDQSFKQGFAEASEKGKQCPTLLLTLPEIPLDFSTMSLKQYVLEAKNLRLR